MLKKRNTKDFIIEAKKVHGNRYDYSLTEYKGWASKVIIICSIHGEFNQVANCHLQGSGCRKCGIIKYSSHRRIPLEAFLVEAKKKHANKYDYSFILDYKGIKSKIKIICPIHGEFYQQAYNHIKGCECPKCGKQKTAEKNSMSQEQFIGRSNKIHLNKYDYSKVVYKNGYTNIKIICPIHGEFSQRPRCHLNGSGCPKCGKVIAFEKLSYNREEFIAAADEIHNKKYDYSLVEYKGIFNKIKIICSLHGEFNQGPHIHLQGSGCPICKGVSISKKLTMSLDDFVKRANIIHSNKYDYSKSKYKDTKEKIEIICPQHGVFFQKPEKHLAGQGCTMCSIEKGVFKVRGTAENFIAKAEKIHSKKYDYSKIIYKNSDTKVLIICPKHGSFFQTPDSHLRSGCPRCNESYGERLISRYLQEHNIEYERQKKFEGCKNKKCLPFDFFIPVLNVCIEYDGVIHFFPLDSYGGVKGFEALKKRDEIKNKFCQENNIKLIRIPYYMPKPKIRSIFDSIRLKMLSKDKSPEEICKMLNIDREKLSELETKAAVTC